MAGVASGGQLAPAMASAAEASCPLCSAPLPSAQLEAHLRLELDYDSFRCRLCPVHFFTEQDALEHFRGLFAKHPRSAVAYNEVRDRGKDEELARLLGLPTPPPPQIASYLGSEAEEPEESDQTDPKQPKASGQPEKKTGLAETFRSPEAKPCRKEAEEEPKDLSLLCEDSVGPHDYKAAVPALRAPVEDTKVVAYEPAAVEVLVAAFEREERRAAQALSESPGRLNRSAVRESHSRLLRCGDALCGAVVGANNARSHVLHRHLDRNLFLCRHCSYGTNLRQTLMGHISRQHPGAGAESVVRSEETSRLVSEGLRRLFDMKQRRPRHGSDAAPSAQSAR